MMRMITMILLIIAGVATAAPATNRVNVTRGGRSNMQIQRGQPAAKSLLKTQPRSAIRAKNSDDRTVDLPLMFSNNRIKELKQKKENKK